MRPAAVIKDAVLPAVVIIVGLLAVFWLSGFIERVRPALPEEYSDSDLTVRGARMKGFAFGAEGLIADYYFMRSLQYVGNKVMKSESELVNLDDLRSLNPRLLYPLLDNATDLDPHFIAPYSYGAVVLPAIDPSKAIALANKGIANNPEHWRLYQHLGYIYWKLGQYEKAAETYERGSEIAGASPFMKLMAASMKTRGGSRETAREIFTEMLANSDDEQVQITARRRLAELDSLDERDAIDGVLATFRSSNGRCVNSLGEILPSLQKVDLPGDNEFAIDKQTRLVDPTGAPYLLDQENCRVKLDPTATGLPLQ
jgi:tetratricopeptide (TPR) repeat protein